jgi:xanthine dehydrogenase accessory factor
MNAGDAAGKGKRVFDIAGPVLAWLRDHERTVLVRTIDVQGFSSRWPQDALAVTARGALGEVLGGAARSALEPLLADALATDLPAAVHTISISDAAAATAGLSCGGQARVLLQPAGDIPQAAWSALALREAVCIVTPLVTEQDGDRDTTWFSRRLLGTPDAARAAPDPRAVQWFGRGVCATTVMNLGTPAAERESLVTALWPTSRLVIVGDGLLAAALEGVAGLLDWDPEVVPGVFDAVAAVGSLKVGDAVVVLTHDRDVDGPVLTAALEAAPGYIGALGSRRTQQARAGWLRDRGVPDSAIASIHGPAGLDIGARTPGEIALSIASEIVSVRSGAGGSALRDRTGPIHHDRLNTPPARHETAGR